MAQIFQDMLLGYLMSVVGNKKMGSLDTKFNKKDLIFMKEFLEAGKVVPVIERRYTISEVPEAIR